MSNDDQAKQDFKAQLAANEEKQTGQTVKGGFGRWRAMTWVFLAFNAIMLFWVVAGIKAASDAANCVSGDDLCGAANDVGTAIGVGLIIVLWFVGFIILGFVWMMTKSRRRSCPVCGNGVKNGMLVCRSCGHDFRGVNVAVA